jgi:ubiquinone/menaquinone biosynthesis C-methylase UbiE
MVDEDDVRARVRRRWDSRSRGYDRAWDWCERLVVGDSRARLVAGVTGDALEVGVGTGRNLRHYGGAVRLVAVDLSPGMLGQARATAGRVGRDVTLVEADAARLPFGDAAFDTVVCTLAVCAVPDREAALGEMVRVLRPGGVLRLLDHVEPRWRAGRPATLAGRLGLVPVERRRLRAGAIELFTARKP